MQNFTDIPSTRTLSDSLAEILNNDKTALSLSSGTAFPTTNLQLGMPCYRSDQQKLYILTQISPSAVWKLWMDFTGSEGKAPNAEAVDGVDSSTIVQNTRQIIAGTGLSGGGDLSANLTLSLAAGAAAANLGYTPVNKSGDTMTGGLTVQNSINVNGAGGAFFFASRANSAQQFAWYCQTDKATLYSNQGVGDIVQIDHSGRVTMPYQPAFTAYGGIDVTGPTSAVIWSLTELNRGGHYNSSNGRFTCPIAGVYLFHYRWLSNQGQTIQPRLFKNGVGIEGATHYGNPSAGQYLAGCISVAIQCNQGDYITCGTLSGAPLQEPNYNSGFSGHLIG